MMDDCLQIEPNSENGPVKCIKIMQNGQTLIILKYSNYVCQYAELIRNTNEGISWEVVNLSSDEWDDQVTRFEEYETFKKIYFPNEPKENDFKNYMKFTKVMDMLYSETNPYMKKYMKCEKNNKCFKWENSMNLNEYKKM